MCIFSFSFAVSVDLYDKIIYKSKVKMNVPRGKFMRKSALLKHTNHCAFLITHCGILPFY